MRRRLPLTHGCCALSGGSVARVRAKLAEEESSLARLESANAAIKHEYDRYHAMQALRDTLVVLKQKLAWTKYMEQYERVQRAKAQYKEARLVLKQERRSCKPAQDLVTKLEGDTERANVGVQEVRVKVTGKAGANRALARICADLDKRMGVVADEEEDLRHKKADLVQREARLKRMETALVELRQELAEAPEVGDIAPELSEVKRQLRREQSAMDAAQDEAQQCKTQQLRIKREALQLKADLTKLENVKEQRLGRLQRGPLKDTYNAVQWLRCATRISGATARCSRSAPLGPCADAMPPNLKSLLLSPCVS